MFRRRQLFVLVIAAVVSCRAQDDSGCLTRIVPVTVTDRKGQPVTDLTAERFRGRFRGQPVKILHARFQPAAGRLVVVLDGSGSMEMLLTRSRIGWTIAANAVATAPTQAVGLLVFSDQTKLRVEPTPNRESVLQQLDTLLTKKERSTALGRTALLDAIHAATQMLVPARTGDVILLISDGGDNRSKITERGLQRELATSGVRLYALVPTDPYPSTTEEREGPGRMGRLAKTTGGYAVFWNHRAQEAEGRQRLGSLLERMYYDFRNYYQLIVEFPLGADKPRDWKLEVLDERRMKMGRLNLFYPQVTPCPETAQKQAQRK